VYLQAQINYNKVIITKLLCTIVFGIQKLETSILEEELYGDWRWDDKSLFPDICFGLDPTPTQPLHN